MRVLFSPQFSKISATSAELAPGNTEFHGSSMESCLAEVRYYYYYYYHNDTPQEVQ